jgi:hypothetical protein
VGSLPQKTANYFSLLGYFHPYKESARKKHQLGPKRLSGDPV